MGVRAGVVVTGTEVLTGRVADRNGPWLADQLRRVGVDIADIVVVGDRPEDLRDALAFLAGLDLIITTGGLGPTADDLTAEVVGQFQGRASALDVQLEVQIGGIVERLMVGRGWKTDSDATAAATRKQAMVPEGASVLSPVGTAPGLVVPPAVGRAGPPVLVLPGPPRELQGMWAAALADPLVAAALSGREELRQDTMRLWSTPESELSAALRRHSHELAGLEITTCLSDGELEVVTRYAPAAQPAYERLTAALTGDFGPALYSPDGRTVDRIVAQLLLERSWTIATTESCTAGLLAGRLTEQAGSSAYLLGGLVTYSNLAKHELAGVPLELIDRVGAVSEEVAEAMASGARWRLGADVGVGITGVAGPDGGTADKPVGLVHLYVVAPGQSLSRAVNLPGSRSDVRQRTVAIAMHMIRSVLSS
ncbi:competence/damage-inducible protein A [uncultured Jatrophihabitans sp.]|uniref:competence/damage-inducible protein A n=1 Tax=uncultured Jatrophihabitans sp. TaxID=1610747 RepID=UPI0035CA0FAF